MRITYNKRNEVVKVIDNWDILWGKFRNELCTNVGSENKPDISFKNKFKSRSKYKLKRNRVGILLSSICTRLIKIKK